MPRIPVLLLGFAVLCVARAGCVQVRAGEEADLAAAKRAVREGRGALEEIVGRELLRAEVPPLPELPELGLSQAEVARIGRLADSAPEIWTAEERARIGELLALDLRLRAALRAADGESLDSGEVATRGLALLKAGRLLTVRDRLALLEGDEAAFLDGLELRMGLAERLWLQPAVVGPLLGSAIFQSALADVQQAVEREETSQAGLARLEALLLRWRLRVPDAAAVLAREGLLSLERPEERAGDLAAGDPAEVFLMAHVAHDFALLARGCREEGCQAAVGALHAQREERDSDPYRVIADMLIPNLVNTAERLDGLSALADLAGATVAVRIEAEESGTYPPRLEGLPALLPAGRWDTAEWSYERRAEGGVRLGLSEDAIASPWPDPRRAEILELLSWELPPPGDEMWPPPGED